MRVLSVRGATVLGAALLLISFAGSARAQFDECPTIGGVPEAVYDTIVSEASFLFGDLDQKVCNTIVKKGVKTCKQQVKAAQKCIKVAAASNLDITNKQCKQLDTNQERKACKQNAKLERKSVLNDASAQRSLALDVCTGEFADALLGSCLIGEAM